VWRPRRFLKQRRSFAPSSMVAPVLGGWSMTGVPRRTGRKEAVVTFQEAAGSMPWGGHEKDSEGVDHGADRKFRQLRGALGGASDDEKNAAERD